MTIIVQLKSQVKCSEVLHGDWQFRLILHVRPKNLPGVYLLYMLQMIGKRETKYGEKLVLLGDYSLLLGVWGFKHC